MDERVCTEGGKLWWWWWTTIYAMIEALGTAAGLLAPGRLPLHARSPTCPCTLGAISSPIETHRIRPGTCDFQLRELISKHLILLVL